MLRPFMDTPEQLAGLEGQQYVVLRPTAAVAETYRNVQDASLARLGAPIRGPHTGHVTLRGFAEPDRRDELAALILSVIYGKTLDPAEWRRFAEAESRVFEPAVTETITEAELVWYDRGIEHAEVLPLGG